MIRIRAMIAGLCDSPPTSPHTHTSCCCPASFAVAAAAPCFYFLELKHVVAVACSCANWRVLSVIAACTRPHSVAGSASRGGTGAIDTITSASAGFFTSTEHCPSSPRARDAVVNGIRTANREGPNFVQSTAAWHHAGSLPPEWFVSDSNAMLGTIFQEHCLRMVMRWLSQHCKGARRKK